MRPLLGALAALLALLVAPSTPVAAAAPAAQVAHVGTYNVEYGHPVAPHVKMILEDARRYNLDVLALQEIQDYQHALRQQAPAAGYRFYGLAHGGSRDGFLVATRDRVSAWGHFETGGWWWQSPGHRVTTATTIWIIVNGVEYDTVHAPVHAWTPCGPCAGGRAFAGPAPRRDAYSVFVHDEIRHAWHRHTPLVLLGDWNSSPGARGPASPNHLRLMIHGRFIATGHSTGHGEIDFAIATHGIAPTSAYTRPNLRVAHSDHLLVTAELRRVGA